jgi:hypothetical protein
MKLQWLRRIAPAVTVSMTLTALALSSLTPARAAPFDGQRTQFADEGFRGAWTRTDAEAVRGGRTWYWGPTPWFDYAEFYRQGGNGLRTVQYFDKARMEINNPNDRSYQGGVTNGLLVKELVSGRMQLGNDPYDTEQREAADVPVAGNPRNANAVAPGYAAFAGVATLDNGYRDPQRLRQRITTTLDRGGNIGVRDDLALAETEIAQYNSVTGHNIPKVFWDFMNQRGRILVGGWVATGPVADWLFAMGLPITDAYWTRAQVGNVEKDVLVQLFERRVLTYVPDNPVGYKVEMGNVGQHYFQWRYAHLGTPWAAPEPALPLIYASNSDTGDHWELYMKHSTGSSRITTNNEETVAFSWRRSWDPGQVRLLVDSRRSNPEFRQIYEFDPPAFYGGDHAWNAGVRRISYTDGTTPPGSGPYPGYLPRGVAHEFNASYSPDGAKIVFVSDRNGNPELFIMSASANSPMQLTSNGCINEVPTWSPNGRTIFWAHNCDGDFEIYRADIAYNHDSQYSVDARLVNVKQLTNNNSDDRFARVSPNGQLIAFGSNREGNYEIYMINSADGGGERRLTVSNGDDDAPTWSADGATLAFASNRDGDWEIYTMDLSGAQVTKLTNNAAQDRWPLWAQ